MQAVNSTAPRTLIADDQQDVLEALRLLLKGEGYQTEAVTTPADVIEALKVHDFDLLLMDLNYARDTTSGQEGLDLLSRVQAVDSELPIVVMTAWGSVELAVEAMRRGVRDFVLKPWENNRLLAILRTQIEMGYAQRKTHRLKKEHERELVEARSIQRRLLPSEIPQIEGCRIAAAWRPARAVSGDYFDVVKFSDSKAALCIADVSGKGMPAALLMSNVQAAVKSFASETISPSELCAKVNQVVSTSMGEDKFITFFYAVVDAERKKLAYSNAGHNAGMLLHLDGSITRLEPTGAVLGPFPNWNYKHDEVDLASGDRLLLITDGVTELRNSLGEEFGEERLVELLVQNRELEADNLRDRIVQAVLDFSGGEFQDDATMVVLRA
ncbi:MAG TPA: SpoIIE family protein phosphatase [Blastocatellia bacterium]|nr:SpoIIE family protein phosphatase [Blastocatellia bacterium]